MTPFSAVVRTRLLVHSNEEPTITGARADTSRLILIDVAESKTKSDPTWKKRLHDELPFLLYRAREAYRRLCPNHGDIQLTESAKARVQDVADEHEDRWAEHFRGSYVRDPDGFVEAAIVRELLANIPGIDCRGDLAYKDFLKWLQREGIRKSKSGGRRGFWGMRTRTAASLTRAA
jgi:hypothetical protein